MVGHVPKYNGTATLGLERIVAIALASIQFEVDPAFDPHKCRSDAFGVSWQDPKQVVLRFRADQAAYVRERLWHPSQEIADLPDGSISLSFRAGGPFEIRRWILDGVMRWKFWLQKSCGRKSNPCCFRLTTIIKTPVTLAVTSEL